MGLIDNMEGGKGSDPLTVPFEMDEKVANSQNEQQASSKDQSPKIGLRGVRFASFLMILFWICCIVLDNSIKVIDITPVKCGIADQYAEDPTVLQDCVRHTAIFRIAAVVVVLLVAQALLSLFFVNKDNLSLWDNYWLLVKLPFFILASFGLLYPAKLTFFDDAVFAWIARFGGFLFICFQSVVFLDWAYQFNESMIQKVTGKGLVGTVASKAVEGLSGPLICLLLFATGNISLFFTSIGLMYKNYGSKECPDNVFIITLSLILVIVATLLQLFNSSGHGSVTTSGVLAIYVAYTTYTAVELNPSPVCNVPLSTNLQSYGIGPMVLGLILSFLSILYITLVAARKIATMMSSGPVPFSGLIGIVAGYQSGAEYGATGTKLDFSHLGVKVLVLNLNIVFLLVTFYIAMIMTNWGTIVSGFTSVGSATKSVAEIASTLTAGSVSMYMNAIGGWVAALLYIIALIIPRWSDCIPTRIWDLRLKFSN